MPTPGPTTTSSSSSTSSTPVAPTSTVTIPAVVPTPIPQTCPTPGTYTFPATTIVLTETTTVCGASTTTVPSGTHTLGGVTTVVTTATTVTCPYATTKVTSGVVTSVIETTTYVCPSAGTYTIGPITETVTATETVVVVPVVETYCPGTYTAPAVTTVVTTQTVVYCPYTSSVAPTLAATTPTEAAPVEATPTATKAVESPSAGGSYSAGGKSIAYTPYTPDEGLCKSASEVDADIAKIAKAGFAQVRTYSTDCDTLPNVGAACEKYGIKMIVGIFIGQAGCTNASPDVEEQISALKSWKKWSIVPLVVVANEALFQGHCTPSELAALITHVKSELGSTGYTGAYTTTDTVGAWIQAGVAGAICDLVDIVGVNSYPYFNGATLASAAGDFVASQLEIVEKLCGKDGAVLECGHPSEGKCYGPLCGNKDTQKEVIGSIIDKLGDKVTILGFENDLWKAKGDCECEQSWGCLELFGN